jgi:uncharacterized protein YeaO (DUF488 family)
VLAPSRDLRTWFGHRVERWAEFRARYRQELSSPDLAARLDELAGRARQGPVTLVFGAHDREHNQARVIADELARRLGRPGS